MVELEHHRTFTAPSRVEDTAEGPNLHLATSAPEVPVYFQGRFIAPRRAADLLLCLSQVVGSRFHTPTAMVARLIRESDPVITCGLDRIRWEGFSACCSAYVRVDMRPTAIDGALLHQGTTNVDFGPQMRAALSRLCQESSCSVTIGRHGVEMRSETEIVEKVVALPPRWLRGFLEACYHQRGMVLVSTIRGPEIRRFLQSLPRDSSRGDSYVTSAGRGLRLTFSPSPGAHRLSGWQRLRPLESLLTHARTLQLYSSPSGATGWVLDTPDASLTLALSPDVWRGFSGEGQALWELAQDWDPEQDDDLLSALDWEASLCSVRLAGRTGRSPAQVESALARFAALGLVGFDLSQAASFRRHLPYRGQKIETLHPRLRAARKLVEVSAVRWEGRCAWVQSGEVAYRVTWDEEEASCSCPWYAKYQQQRGACKHILAAQLERARL